MNTCGIIRCLVDVNNKMWDVRRAVECVATTRRARCRVVETRKVVDKAATTARARARRALLSRPALRVSCLMRHLAAFAAHGFTTVEFPGKLRDYSTPRDSGIQIVKCRSESGHAVENAVDSHCFFLVFLCGMLSSCLGYCSRCEEAAISLSTASGPLGRGVAARGAVCHQMQMLQLCAQVSARHRQSQ